MEKLYAAGRRQIDFIGVDQSDATTGALRLQAYQQFCAEHQLPCRYLTGSLDVQSGYDLTAKLLTPATDAVVCATDTLAMGAAKYLQEQQRHDVQLTGVGNNPLLHFLFPQVLSVDPGYKQAGRLAAEQLLLQLEQQAEPCAQIAPSHDL